MKKYPGWVEVESITPNRQDIPIKSNYRPKAAVVPKDKLKP
jgi:hypothetical protein